MKEYTLREVEPILRDIAKQYGLKLYRVSDFKIARTIWAKGLKDNSIWDTI